MDKFFAKMPTETEISKNGTLNISPSPVRIFITNAIRIEVMPECPPELFHVLIQGLKDHAWSGGWHNRLPCLWSYRSEKSYHGLVAIIKLKFKLDPYSHCMFAFCNRRRTSIKILQWDGSGFWILMKRLDRDSFHWPDTPDELQKVTLKEMHWLCDGLSLTPKGAFEERSMA